MEARALQHRVDGDGRKKKAHALFPDYERDACLAPTLTCAGLGGCYRDGEPRMNGGSVNCRNTRLAPSLTRAGLVGGCSDGGAEEKKHT